MWVYIMASRYRGTLYVGVTNTLARRVDEHKSGIGSDFMRRYKIFRLVHAARFETPLEAITHEKRLKRWARNWKFQLIEKDNPHWRD